MKTFVFAWFGWLMVVAGFAQPALVALEGKTMTPQERFLQLKANSVTYQDYKVIHENTLNGVWAILTDTLAKRDHLLAETSTKITTLQNEITFVRSELKVRESAMAEITFASTHMTVMGIGFTKSGFLFTTFIIFLCLSGAVLVLGVRVKLMSRYANESKVIVKSTTDEFEEYKRKAMDKYIKVSRELQTERNKVIEMKHERSLR